MILRRRTLDEPGFQLAPMIDMTFLLLVFFMVTTKIARDQIHPSIALPTASGAVTPKDLADRDILSIDGAGTLHIGATPASEGEVRAHLRKRFENHPPLRLYVRADAATPARRVKELMAMAAEAGATDVLFGAYREDP